VTVPAGTRFLRFNLVGLLGAVVQIAALAVLDSGMGLDYRWATALAVEIAVLHNWVWHERYTWRERVSGAPDSITRRLLVFHVTNGAVSLAGNLLLMRLLVGGAHVNHLLANLFSIGACGLGNFLSSDRLVFRPRSPERAES
jgi:putative flippase GtrA